MTEEKIESDEEIQEGDGKPDVFTGYVQDLNDLEPDAVEHADVILYEEDSDELFDELEEQVDTELEDLSEGSFSLEGTKYVLDDFTEDVESPEIFDEEMSVEDLYDEEELENIAGEMSNYEGIGSSIPVLGSVLDFFLGSNVDQNELTLDQIENEGYANEAHQKYLEAQNAYEEIKQTVESSEQDVVLFGSSNPITAKINQEYESVDLAPTERISGYEEIPISAEGGIYNEETPEMMAKIANQQGGVDELYEGIESSVSEERYEHLEEMRDQVEEIYEEEYSQQENSEQIEA